MVGSAHRPAESSLRGRGDKGAAVITCPSPCLALTCLSWLQCLRAGHTPAKLSALGNSCWAFGAAP